MRALLDVREKFGAVQVVGLVSKDDDPEPRYRVLCLKCESDCVLAAEDALLSGRVRTCFDCAAVAKMTDAQRALAAFRQTLDLSPEQEVLDCVDSFPRASAPITVGEALAA